MFHWITPRVSLRPWAIWVRGVWMLPLALWSQGLKEGQEGHLTGLTVGHQRDQTFSFLVSTDPQDVWKDQNSILWVFQTKCGSFENWSIHFPIASPIIPSCKLRFGTVSWQRLSFSGRVQIILRERKAEMSDTGFHDQDSEGEYFKNDWRRFSEKKTWSKYTSRAEGTRTEKMGILLWGDAEDVQGLWVFHF